MKYIKKKFMEKKDQRCDLPEAEGEGKEKLEEYGPKVLTSSNQTDKYSGRNLQDDYIDRSKGSDHQENFLSFLSFLYMVSV